MTNRHPTASKWAKWPAPLDVGEIHASEAFRQHVRAWHHDRTKRPLPVYRQDLDDRATPTIADVRKAYRLLLTHADDLACLLVYALQRIKKLEERAVPKYLGVWHSNGKYAEGSIVTHDGSMWFCKAETTDKPGSGDGWQLCVKHGRDGKDLR